MLLIDWGTTSLRLFEVNDSGETLGHRRSNRGISQIDCNQFEAILAEEISAFNEIEYVFLCGMIGSSQGLWPTTYIETPADKTTYIEHSRSITSTHPQLTNRRIVIMPGVRHEDNTGKIEVMRGEEAQIFGFCSTQPNFRGAVVLPGTHSKWVQIQDGTIIDIKTYMTGELFQTIRANTILQHTTTSDTEISPDLFSQGVRAAMTGESILNTMFQSRTQVLNGRWNTIEATSFLSGLLIGSELHNQVGIHETIVVIGESKLAHLYKSAFKHFNVDVTLYDDSIISGCSTFLHPPHKEAS